jgi:hypothetical protein
MPKPKKSESTPARKPPAKSPAKSPSKPAASGFPSIDTNLAASSAARMLLRKPSAADSAAPKKESGAFKNLKESLNTPSLGSLDQFMGSTGPQRSNTSHHRDQQKGHNQTFGADVNRTGVPRRTTGG